MALLGWKILGFFRGKEAREQRERADAAEAEVARLREAVARLEQQVADLEAGLPPSTDGQLAPMRPGSIQPVILFTSVQGRGLALRYREAVDRALRQVYTWYEGEMGVPFRDARLCALVRVPSDLEARYVGDPLDTLAVTVERLGLPNRSAGGAYMPYIYIGFAPGCGGFAGTVHHLDQVGLAGLGDACLLALSGDSQGCLAIIGGSQRRASESGQTGALAHELMHALGWGEHTDTPGLDLSSWEYETFPDCHLPEVIKSFYHEERQRVYFRGT